MGSTMIQITLIFIYIVNIYIAHTLGNPNQLHEKQNEFETQRLSNMYDDQGDVGMNPSGYYNKERTNDEITGIVDKLRSDYNSAQDGSSNSGNRGYYRSSYSSSRTTEGGKSGCSTDGGCSRQQQVATSTTGNVQDDQIAKEMTEQIIAELQSGKLTRHQINQPNWFENKVTERLQAINQQRQTQHQQNLYYGGGGGGGGGSASMGSVNRNQQENYDNDAELLQQHQQNVFDHNIDTNDDDDGKDDVQQVQQNVFNHHTQHQQQGRNYQHQTQQHQTNYDLNDDRRHSIYNHLSGTDYVPQRFRGRWDHPYQPGLNHERINEENYNIEQSFRPYVSTIGSYAPFQIITYKSNITRERPLYPHNHNDLKYTKEKHDVQTNVLSVVPKVNFKLYSLSSTDYNNRLRATQDILQQLGYDRLSDIEYNTTIAAEGFTHNGYKYDYNEHMGIYEKGSKVEIDDKLYQQMIGNIQNQLSGMGIEQLSDEEYRQIVASGIFIRNGVQWNYNQNTGKFENDNLINHNTMDYRQNFVQFQNQLKTLGYSKITEEEYNETITTGYFIRGGSKWQYNHETGSVEQIRLPVNEHRIVLMKLEEELKRLGLQQLTPQESNQVLKTGICIRDGFRWTYDAHTGKYERHENENYNQDYMENVRRVQDQLMRMGYTHISENEYKQIIRTGVFQNGTDKFIYNFQTGQFEKEQIDREQYNKLLRRLQDSIHRLGYNQITEEEYNETITTGYFIRGGNKWQYDTNAGRLQKVEFSETQHNMVLIKLQEELRRLGLQQMTQNEFNQAIKTGVFIRNGNKWSYDAKLGRYQKSETTNDDDYRIMLHSIQNQLNHLGYNQITEKEYNETIRTGVFIRGSEKWIYNFQTGTLDKTQIDQTEYHQMINNIHNQLQRLGYKDITEEENNRTITTGYFIRGSDKWRYDTKIDRFEKIEIPVHEHELILMRLQDELKRLGLRQMTAQEYTQTMNSRTFIRNGVKWSYDAKSGQYQENQLTEDEYSKIFSQITYLLRQMGYNHLTDEEYNKTITTGYFVKGPNKYWYNYQMGTFDKESLTEDKHRVVLMDLQNELKRLGYDKLTQKEYNQALTTNEIIRGNIKWIYNAEIERYEQSGISNEEYRTILRTLQMELNRLGYTTNEITEQEYNKTISTGVFIRGGDKWIFDSNIGQLQKVELTTEDYHTILRKIQNQLSRLGYNRITEEEYNQTITTGFFISGGDKWQYNYDTEQFEKIQLTENEQSLILHQLEDELRRQGFSALTEYEYNEAIKTGVFIRGGNKWIYDAKTNRYEMASLTESEYRKILQNYQVALKLIGHTQLSEKEYNETINTGIFIQGGNKWNYNYITGRFEKIQLNETKHRKVLQNLQIELKRLGYNEMSEEEFLIALQTGVFIRGTVKFTYDARTEKYIQNQLTIEEHNQLLTKVKNALARLGIWELDNDEYTQIIKTGEFIYQGNKYIYDFKTERLEMIEMTEVGYNHIIDKIRETLQKLGYRQMNEREFNDTISKGYFVRGGYQWKYDSETGTAHKIRTATRQEEISDQEYNEIYRRLQATLKKLGYRAMTENECLTAISSGTFTRGGNQWVYNPYIGQFERIELTDTEYKHRLNALKEELKRIGQGHSTKQLTEQELREIIIKGYFTNGGYRWEYNSKIGSFERLDITAEEYRNRLIKLREQLKRMNYGEMSDADCEKTIYSGVFYYGGYKWVYNFDTGYYEMKEKSNVEEVHGPVDSTIDLDETKYDTTNKNDTNTNIGEHTNSGHKAPWVRPTPVIHKNRGDQPPQHFDDYESEEVIELEPGIGYYPGITKKPEINTLPPVTTRIPTRYPPIYTAPLAQYETATTRITKYESQQTVVPPVLNQHGYQSRYETSHKSYSRKTATMPPDYRNYQADEPHKNQPEDLSQTLIGVGHETEDLTQQQEDLSQKFIGFGQETEDLTQQQEDLSQKFIEFGQETEDLTQQQEDLSQKFIGFGQETEDLTQQQEDLSQTFVGMGQATNHPSKNDNINDKFTESTESLNQQFIDVSNQNHHETIHNKTVPHTPNVAETEIDVLNMQTNDEVQTVEENSKETEKPGFFKRIAQQVKTYVSG